MDHHAPMFVSGGGCVRSLCMIGSFELLDDGQQFEKGKYIAGSEFVAECLLQFGNIGEKLAIDCVSPDHIAEGTFDDD